MEHEGQQFVINKRHKNGSTYYRCAQKLNFGCRSTIKMNMNGEVTIINAHNGHLQIVDHRKQFRTILLRRALRETTPSRIIYDEELARYPAAEEVSYLYPFSSARNTISTARKRHLEKNPPVPIALQLETAAQPDIVAPVVSAQHGPVLQSVTTVQPNPADLTQNNQVTQVALPQHDPVAQVAVAQDRPVLQPVTAVQPNPADLTQNNQVTQVALPQHDPVAQVAVAQHSPVLQPVTAVQPNPADLTQNKPVTQAALAQHDPVAQVALAQHRPNTQVALNQHDPVLQLEPAVQPDQAQVTTAQQDPVIQVALQYCPILQPERTVQPSLVIQIQLGHFNPVPHLEPAAQPASVSQVVIMAGPAPRVVLKPRSSECCVCKRLPSTHACLPCGHMCCCLQCTELLKSSMQCPICQRHVNQFNRIFIV